MKFILSLTLVLFASLAHADAWDNLTLEEANAVVQELNSNPYIFDYCDCCDNAGEYATSVHLLKVISTEIIPCNWDNNYYSVRVQSKVIANVHYGDDGPDMNRLSQPESPEMSELIYMNYTWTFHPENKMATPFFNIVPYNFYGDDQQPCRKEFAYPTPKQLKFVSKDKGYKKWYKQSI